MNWEENGKSVRAMTSIANSTNIVWLIFSYFNCDKEIN